MKLALITTTLSPHQFPLAKRLAERLGEDRFRYIAVDPLDPGRVALGWSGESPAPWILQPAARAGDRAEAERWSRDADVVLCATRDVVLYCNRAAQGKVSFYMSERWFKPPLGMARVLHPSYAGMALGMIGLMQSPRFFFLPMGVAAAGDVWRLSSEVSRLPGLGSLGRLALAEKMRLWGYFVEPAETSGAAGGAVSRPGAALRVLWCGRLLGWKRVDTLIRAAVRVGATGRAVSVTLVGQGPEESGLRRLAASLAGARDGDVFTAGGATVAFRPPVPVAEVRDLMRASDVYVLASNGYEGWGAVVNEAMEEGCVVIASRESGAASALVREGENGLKFSSGDVAGLADCLSACADDPDLCARLARQGRRTLREQWSPDVGAERLLACAEAALSDRPLPHYADGPLRELA